MVLFSRRLVVRSLIALTVLVILSSVADAGPRQRRSMRYSQETIRPQQGSYSTATTDSGSDALNEVNSARAQRGLPPFIHDPNLASAAEVCAGLRAQYLLAGHTANDFAALPFGVSASAAGCGALDPSWGWGTCCTFDNYRYAGAAVVVGRDGRRFMHLFVR